MGSGVLLGAGGDAGSFNGQTTLETRMRIMGTTPDGRRIMKLHGGIIQEETAEQRDSRLEQEAYDAVRDAAPELLQALRGVMAIIMEANLDLGEQGGGADQAFSYALEIIGRLCPPDVVPTEPPDHTA